MEEIWKDIEGYEGFYQVSNLGQIKSLDRYIKCKNGAERYMKGRILNHTVNKKRRGYCEISLHMNGKEKRYKVHRLVALAFLPNPYNKPEVNHKDEDKENNRVDNLEWVTSKENANHGSRNKRCGIPSKKKIKQIDKEGNVVKIWDSSIDAGKILNISSSGIRNCTCGRTKTYLGYYWEKV